MEGSLSPLDAVASSVRSPDSSVHSLGIRKTSSDRSTLCLIHIHHGVVLRRRVFCCRLIIHQEKAGQKNSQPAQSGSTSAGCLSLGEDIVVAVVP